MNLCFTYMWKCWRRKSTFVGFVLLCVLCLLGVNLNGPLGKHSPQQENLEEVFKSTQKRLQSEDHVVDQPGVPFLPQKVYFNGFPNQIAPQNFLNNFHNFEAKQNLQYYGDRSGFGAINGPGIPPYRFGNTGAMNVPPQLHPPVFIPIMDPITNQFRFPFPYPGNNKQEPPKEPHFYKPVQRIVHFDLKGAPPRLEYFLKILNWIKEAGATGVVMEYEDMFPFTGKLSKVAASNHFNQSDIQIIVNNCQKLGLEVIPLIQTFGHMEFILKHDEYAELRDTPEMPDSICPCHEGAFPLIVEYIDQVLALHKSSKYLHIGCDEVYHLGGCLSCQGLPRSHLFVSHVSRVAKYVKEKYDKSVIIWDDMLRGFMTNEMLPLANLVEPMVWVYAEEPYKYMTSYNWARLAEVFPTAWTSSAFKGADGPTSIVPNVQKRLENNLKWLELMSVEEEKFREGFRGIALTGWQRYDHFAVLAELLPVGIPSLGVNLLAVTHGFFNETLKSEVLMRLGCIEGSVAFDSFVNLTTDPYLWDKMEWCFFPGAEIFKLTRNLENVQVEVSNYLNKVRIEQGWLTEYSIRRYFSSPMRIDEGLEEMQRVQFSVTSLIRHAQNSLSEVYDDFTVAEWIEQNIYPMYTELAKFKKDATELKKYHHWPKRPLPILPELYALGVGIPTTVTPSTLKDKTSNSVSALQDPTNPESAITAQPKRLVQTPDLYRHPPVSNN